MRSSTPLWLVVIAAITLAVIWMVSDSRNLLGRPIEVRPGLDIQGGLRVLLEAEPGVPVTSDSMDRAKQIIENRVNALGVAEPVIQVSGSNRIVVELPGVRDPKQAIDLIKQTGLLEFVDFSKQGACTAAFPQAGQFIYTDAQQKLRGGGAAVPGTPTGTPTLLSPTATIPATAQATSAATLQATDPATAQPTSTATAQATDLATQSATQSALSSGGKVLARPVFQATVQPDVTATPAPSAQPTSAATLQATVAATAAATPVLRDGSSKEGALINPCNNQPFNTVMTGGGLKDAYAAASGSLTAQWVIQFSINDNEEGRKFGPYTASHIQQQMAIVLDGQVLSAPVIQARLDNGGQITGNFTQQGSKDLALQLRYGALPIPLTTVSIEQVGASLGQESVNATARAGVLGVFVILLYMIIMYRVPGVVAALALLLFAAINFSLFKYIPVTLTLPAITGFLISVGTAVDGNILIFERIKEELRFGRPLDRAIETGFQRAWPSIRDSNISTLMIAAVLFFFGGQFGASSVRGFAITLMLGLVVNIFTAVIVTRTLLDVVLRFAGERLMQNKWLIGE